MSLRVVDLSQVDDVCKSSFTAQQVVEELHKPRSERRGLDTISSDMMCSGSDLWRMNLSIKHMAQVHAAQRISDMVHARFSATSV